MRRQPQQTRGRQRIDLILDTAAQLFVEVGYDTATTNAIAERAGISIGSLYRYFPDKDAILRALAVRQQEQFHALYDRVLAEDVAHLPLADILDRLIDPFLSLSTDSPVYGHILLGADVSPDLAAAGLRMEQEMIDRTADLLRRVSPGLDERRAQLVATICKAEVKALLSLLSSSTDETFQAEVTREVKQMLLAYLAPILGRG